MISRSSLNVREGLSLAQLVPNELMGTSPFDGMTVMFVGAFTTIQDQHGSISTSFGNQTRKIPDVELSEIHFKLLKLRNENFQLSATI